MRIAFVLSGLQAGGAEKIVNLLANHRHDRGDVVAIYAVNAPEGQSYHAYPPSIHVEGLAGTSNGSRPLLILARIRALRQRLVAFKPDLVVSFLTKVNVMTRLATAGLGVPVILSERNNFRVQRMNRLWLGAGALTAYGAARIVMLTEGAKDALPTHLKSKAVVIPNPVLLPDTVLSRRPGPTRLIAAGRLTEQKGFDMLLQAFALIADDLPDLTLTIYGDGPDRAVLQRQARELGIADRVAMPGVTASPAGWLSPGDIFVLSSRYEGFANVLLEALSASMAVLSFNCPWGPAEILEGQPAGSLVPANDIDALAEAIARVAADSVLRSRLADAGPAAAARFSIASVFAKWDEVMVAALADVPVSASLPASHRDVRHRSG